VPDRTCTDCSTVLAYKAGSGRQAVRCPDCSAERVRQQKRDAYRAGRAKLPSRVCAECGSSVGPRMLRCAGCSRQIRAAAALEFRNQNLELSRGRSRESMRRARQRDSRGLNDKKRASRFGLSAEQVQEMLISQNGCCAICGIPAGQVPRGLVVDHDHACCNYDNGRKTCGKCVRQLLCGNCNWMLGLADDQVDRLRAAADYIEHHRNSHAQARRTAA
jgi:hypothetical protein